MCDSGAIVPVEVICDKNGVDVNLLPDSDSDFEARLARLEQVAELLYWTKSTIVSTPLSQERALILDKIYKHKTL